MEKFKDGDEVRYIKEAPKDCEMTIKVNEFVGIYEDGIIFSHDRLKRIPLIGVFNISDCFEKYQNTEPCQNSI